MTVTAARYTVSSAEGCLPGLGHALQFFRDPLGFLSSLPAQGDLVRVQLGRKPLYVACHPEVVHQMLMDPRTFDTGGPFFDKLEPIMGQGLGTARWREHQWQRRVLQPAFTQERMTDYAPVFAEEARAASDAWRPGQVVDVRDAMHTMSVRAMSRTLFGIRAGDQEEVLRSLPIAFDGVYQRMVFPFPFWFRLPTPGNRRFEQAQRRIRRVTGHIIADHRRGSADRQGPVSLLLQAKDGTTGLPLTDQHIHDQIVTLMTGGTDTATNLLAFAFHHLGQHPEIEARLHAEIDAAGVAEEPGSVDSSRLEYTWRVLTETLRLYPAGWFFTRTTSTAAELAGHRLPAGTDVAYSPYLLHRQAADFPDPERFDPDRWLPENTGTARRGAWLPFGTGSRKCIGQYFGTAETLHALATIAARWRLRPVPGTVMRPRLHLALTSGPLPMTCHPRESGRTPGLW